MPFLILFPAAIAALLLIVASNSLRRLIVKARAIIIGVASLYLLIISHAIVKSLLFLCVGTVEHRIGSKDIEDMAGLIVRMSRVAVMSLSVSPVCSWPCIGCAEG